MLKQVCEAQDAVSSENRILCYTMVKASTLVVQSQCREPLK
jgi:hypothetical protein